MKQVFAHYTLWEDYQNGMYKSKCDNIETVTELARELLCSTQEFETTLRELVLKWPVSAAINITAPGNSKSWLGAAACCYLYGIPEFITRIAWNKMTSVQQESANASAIKIIKEYEDRIIN